MVELKRSLICYYCNTLFSNIYIYLFNCLGVSYGPVMDVSFFTIPRREFLYGKDRTIL